MHRRVVIERRYGLAAGLGEACARVPSADPLPLPKPRDIHASSGTTVAASPLAAECPRGPPPVSSRGFSTGCHAPYCPQPSFRSRSPAAVSPFSLAHFRRASLASAPLLLQYRLVSGERQESNPPSQHSSNHCSQLTPQYGPSSRCQTAGTSNAFLQPSERVGKTANSIASYRTISLDCRCSYQFLLPAGAYQVCFNLTSTSRTTTCRYAHSSPNPFFLTLSILVRTLPSASRRAV